MKILITAGATWVKVDEVRILTNKFTGKTGLYLAKDLKKKKHKVTVLINPHCVDLSKEKGIRFEKYHYFDEFKSKANDLLKKNHFDAIIHMAAVSDYRIKNTSKGKISSGKKSLVLKLTPTEKLIRLIREKAPDSLLIQFKLEPKRKGLVDDAYKSLKSNGSDLVVANALEDLKKGYRATIISRQKRLISVCSSRDLTSKLDSLIRLLSGNK
jgi:phosphopantothenoylcysteine decarboxylase/phosphopantothenate--cysteine ligase